MIIIFNKIPTEFLNTALHSVVFNNLFLNVKFMFQLKCDTDLQNLKGCAEE